jgi:hypothetical protein
MLLISPYNKLAIARSLNIYINIIYIYIYYHGLNAIS